MTRRTRKLSLSMPVRAARYKRGWQGIIEDEDKEEDYTREGNRRPKTSRNGEPGGQMMPWK